MGLSFDAGPQSLEDLVETLKPRQLLLVLDNCEHLLEACAGLVEAVLQRCLKVSILATSREPLAVTGEHLYPLAGLTIPDPKHSSDAENLEQYEAVRLFVERARAVQPGFTLTKTSSKDVARICSQLASWGNGPGADRVKNDLDSDQAFNGYFYP